MQIPLDYYRILGVPIQATEQQLTQAYHDRSLQLPRREYSGTAVSKRKELINQAYQVLADPQQRSAYNAIFLRHTSSLDRLNQPAAQSTTELEQIHPHSSPKQTKATDVAEHPSNLPTDHESTGAPSLADELPLISIQPEQLVGALAILQELSEYELVIRLGQTYLERLNKDITPQDHHCAAYIERGDVILSMVLAQRELSRERWQQRKYEHAAVHGEAGLGLLVSEGYFPKLQTEIRAELNRLRPYRILELLSLEREQVVKRSQGIQILKAMLKERQGIDGSGDDQSGLTVNQFLRFVQQLRSKLTVEEQLELFEAEAQRPSLAATYLTAYVLLAKGFVRRMPSLIQRAQMLLKRLDACQDVALEQAVCALLLGQSTEANQALGRCQEQEALASIRQKSQGAPDLLPGLCDYAQTWLYTEVIAQIPDFAQCSGSLQDYFTSPSVCRYLEQPARQRPPMMGERQGKHTVAAAIPSNPVLRSPSTTAVGRRLQTTPMPAAAMATAGATVLSQRSTHYGGMPASMSAGNARRSHATSTTTTHQATGTLYATSGGLALADVPSEIPPIPRESYRSKARSPRRRGQVATLASPSARANGRPPQGLTPIATDSFVSETTLNSGAKRIHLSRFNSMLTILLLAGTGIGLVSWGIQMLQDQRSTQIALQGKAQNQLEIALNAPPVEIPPSIEVSSREATPSVASSSSSIITQDAAQAVIQDWFMAKSKAFGPQHTLEPLQTVLAPQQLSLWRQRAIALQQRNAYREFEHQLQVRNLQFDPQRPNQAVVDASVQEIARHYQGSQLNPSQSYNDRLHVRYYLARSGEGNRWKIQRIDVL